MRTTRPGWCPSGWLANWAHRGPTTPPINGCPTLVEQTLAGSPLTVHITGPAATVADLTVAGHRDRAPIEIAIAVLVLAVLLLVYRNPITMLLPLLTIGLSLVIAQAVVAGYSQLTGSGVSNQSIVFLSAIMAGAGTDYAVFRSAATTTTPDRAAVTTTPSGPRWFLIGR